MANENRCPKCGGIHESPLGFSTYPYMADIADAHTLCRKLAAAEAKVKELSDKWATLVWISLDLLPPKQDQRVLIAGPSYGRGPEWWMRLAVYSGGDWIVEDDYEAPYVWDGYAPTHWMPVYNPTIITHEEARKKGAEHGE